MKLASKKIVFATWLGILVNVLLTITKVVVGLIANSRALLADAAHSASDVFGSVVALFGVKIAETPPDAEHPYGHGKAEHVASFVAAMLLILVGFQLGLSDIKAFWGAPPKAPGELALPVIVLSILIKEALYHYKNRLGRKYNSAVLIAEAWHHRSDALSSIAALVGVGAALIGARFDIPYLLYGDAFAGLLVSLIIIKVGFSLARQSSLVMMEQVLDESEVQKFHDAAQSVAGVLRIDQLHARSHGRYVIIDIKFSVDPHLTVESGHNIGKGVKEHILATYEEVADVLVHVNPFG